MRPSSGTTPVRNSPPLLDFARLLWSRFIQDRWQQTASSLTFATLLAIVPVITVVLTVLSAFPISAAMMTHIELFIVDTLLPESAQTVVSYTQQFTENAGKLTTFGLVF